MKTNRFPILRFIIPVLLFVGISDVSFCAEDPDQLLKWFLETGSREYAEKIRNEFPGSPHEKFCSAWEFIDANNEKARELAKQIVRDHPDFAPGYFTLGKAVILGSEDYAEALSQFNRCIEIDPEFLDAYHLRGIAKIGLEDYAGAEEDFNRVLKLRRGFAQGYLLRGVANYNLGDDEAMKADFEIGLQMDYTALSTIPAKLADDVMDKAIEGAPDNAIYYYARGYSSFVNGNYRSASADFKKCIELVPGSSDFYKYSGASRMHLEDFEGSQTDLNYALSVNPDDPETYYYLGVLMNDFFKQPTMAREYMNLAIELDQTDEMYFYERAKAAFRMMDYEAARNDISTALNLSHRNGDFYALLGNIKMKAGDPAGDYCPDFRKAVEWGTSYNLKRILKKSCQ